MDIGILTAMSSLITAVAMTGSAIYLSKQIRDSRKFVKMQFISGLNEEILHHKEILNKFQPKGEYVSNNAKIENEIYLIVNYLGFFEKIKFLIDSGTIDLNTIDKMFALRFFQVTNNEHVQQSILYKDCWNEHFSALFALHKDWKDFRESNGLNVPQGGNCLEANNTSLYRSINKRYIK